MNPNIWVGLGWDSLSLCLSFFLTLTPIQAWIGTRNICLGMSSLSLSVKTVTPSGDRPASQPRSEDRNHKHKNEYAAQRGAAEQKQERKQERAGRRGMGQNELRQSLGRLEVHEVDDFPRVPSHASRRAVCFITAYTDFLSEQAGDKNKPNGRGQLISHPLGTVQRRDEGVSRLFPALVVTSVQKQRITLLFMLLLAQKDPRPTERPTDCTADAVRPVFGGD